MPVCIEGEWGDYQAPVLTDDGANVPGLGGLRSKRAMRTLIDTGGNCVIMPGPGGFEIKLSPGSRVVRCEDAVSGHMMVPVSVFESRSMRSKTKWILNGTPGNNDKRASDHTSPIKMTRQSNDAACLNFNKEGGHANSSSAIYNEILRPRRSTSRFRFTSLPRLWHCSNDTRV